MRGALAALVLLLVALAPQAGAQPQMEGCRPPVLAVEPAEGPLRPGETRNVRFAIENPNGPPVETVRATITTTAPAGWSATPVQRELTLVPRGVSFDALAVTAPSRGTGEPSGNITLLVTFVCTSGDIQASASASVVIGVAITGFAAPWPVVLAAFAGLAGGVALLGIRRLRRGIVIACAAPERLVAPGKSAKFELQVENRRGRPQRFHLLPLHVPEGWQIHLALDEVTLEPGEEKSLWALLKAPPTALPGDEATVTLRLENARGGRESASVQVRARVSAAGGENKLYSRAGA